WSSDVCSSDLSAHTHPACVFPYWQSARGCWYAGTPASVNSNCQNGADPQERAAAVLAPALGQTARITMQKPQTTFSCPSTARRTEKLQSGRESLLCRNQNLTQLVG